MYLRATPINNLQMQVVVIIASSRPVVLIISHANEVNYKLSASCRVQNELKKIVELV